MEKVKIKDFTNVITGGTPSTSKNEYWENGEIPWLNSGELNQKIICTSRNYITKLGLEKSSSRMMPQDSVLMALTGSTTGVVGYLTFEACANQSVTGILPSKKHNSKYLYHYLNHIRPKVINDAYGGAQPHISQGYVKELQIPLPDLPTQQKIANILDKADELRQYNQLLIEKYDALTQSLFLDMFGDPVKNEKGFELVTIRDLCSEVKYGTSEKANDNGKYPYLRMNNISFKGYMDFKDLKYVNLSDKDLPKYIVKKGDVLFNRTNSKELVGKTGIITNDDIYVIAGYLIRVRTNEYANPYFIWAYLNSKWAKLTLNNMCKNIVGMANINAQELQDIIILKAPIELQNQFAERVHLIETQKQQAQETLAKSEALFQGLLQQAFNGTLCHFDAGEIT